MAAELYGAEYWARENRLRRALNVELRRLSARTDEEAYAALLSLSLFRRACTQTEQRDFGSGRPEQKIPATALCAETVKAGKTGKIGGNEGNDGKEGSGRSGSIRSIRRVPAVAEETSAAKIGESV